MSLTAEAEEMLWQAITEIEAQEVLVAIQVSAYPDLPKTDKERVHRAFHKQAYPHTHEARTSISIEQLAAVING
jgi:hypothetical protein